MAMGLGAGFRSDNSRFFTGPSALFGMTRAVGGESVFSQRWKRCASLGLYAALKRRSFTVVLAIMDGPSIPIKIKSKVRGNVKAADSSVRPTRSSGGNPSRGWWQRLAGMGSFDCA
jgi:hypothetical protein